MVATTKTGANVVANPSRREFLNYALGASVLLAGAGTCAGLAWFTNEYQRPIAYTEQNGYFSIELETLSQPGELPINLLELRTWLVNTEEGLRALYAVCTFHGCLPKWSYSNYRFECPCCGGKFSITGEWIEGPAPRNMDQYRLIVTTDAGTVVTPDTGLPVSIDGATAIMLDTNQRIMGTSRFPRRYR